MALPELVMAVVFALAALLQLNDPDPLPWFAIYAAAAACCGAALLDLPTRVLSAVIALTALGWATTLVPQGPVSVVDLFSFVRTMTPQTEQHREFLGLLLVAGWMAGVFVRSRRR